MTKLGQFLEVREDVMDESLDGQVAPEIGDVVTGQSPYIYSDPVEFFRRTYFTDSMLDIFERLLDTFEGKSKQNVYLVYSLFGGGKTHTLLALYHAFRNPEALLDDEVLAGYPEEKVQRIKAIAERLENASVEIVVIYGKENIGQPSNPLDFGAYKVQTVWGYLGHVLGKYYLVRADDDNLTVPAVSTIRKLFEDKKVLLLVDEIAHHFSHLKNSDNERDRRYAKNGAMFFDVLATAIYGSNTALVVTLPVSESLKVEKEYDNEVVISLWQGLSRSAGHATFSPLRTEGPAGGEIAEVLKKKIFKTIKGKDEVISIYRDVYTSNEEVFGMASDVINDIQNTYPFHPEYISVLRTIIERVGLQKTRDMVRITRIVVRNLVRQYEETGFAPSLIMPYHIPLKDNRIRGSFFARKSDVEIDFSSYGVVVDQDLADSNFGKELKGELGKIIVTYIFLKTFPYDQPTPLPVFPTRQTIAKAVYEHNLFEKEGWLPTDIADVVGLLTKAGKFIYLNTSDDGRFWFWRIANVREMINSKKKEILESRKGEVLARLEDYIEKMVFKGSVTGRKRSDHKIPFFSEKNIIVTREVQEELVDSEDYKLLILLKEENFVSKDVLRNILYKSGTGTKTYKNTTVVAYMKNGSLEKLMDYTAEIIACDEVKEEIKVKYGNYGRDPLERKQIIEVQTSIARRTQETALGNLEESSVEAFGVVAYPEDDDVSTTNASPASKSIVQNVYDALVQARKIETDINFDGLSRYLKDKANINLERRRILFEELRRIIKSNTRLPMVEDSKLKDAIKDGVVNLKIGIKRGDRVIFKRIYNERPPLHEERGEIDSIRDGDLIIPAREALEEQINSILPEEKEEVRGNKLIKVWFEVYETPTSEPRLLRDLVEKEGERYRIKEDNYESLLYGYIVRKYEEILIEEERDFLVKLYPKSVEGKPGSLAEIRVEVTPLTGGEEFEVELEVEEGELESTGGKVPFSTTWTLEIPKEKRRYRITVRADGLSKSDEVTLIPRTDVVEVPEITKEHIGSKLLEIKNISTLEDFERIPETLEGIATGHVEIAEPYEYEATFRNLDVALLRELIKPVKDFKPLLNLEVSTKIDIEPLEEITIDEWWVEALRPLARKAIFKIKREG